MTTGTVPAAQSQGRLATRLLIEMRLTSLVRTIEVVRKLAGGSFVFDRGIFFLAVLRASSQTMAGWPNARPVDDASEGGISINALSQSMRRPFETVRRHVNALIRAGLCDRSPGGVVVAPRLREDPDVAALMVHLHDSMVWVTGEFHNYGLPLPRAAAGVPYRPEITLAASIDLSLAAFENVGLFINDWLELAVVAAVLMASARPITLDPELARRYADLDTPPPVERRVAVSTAAISRALDIPYSTVRRQVMAAVESGKLTEHGGGVIISDMLIGGPAAATVGAAAVTRTASLLGRMVSGGFPFDDPVSAYLSGPPPLVAFD